MKGNEEVVQVLQDVLCAELTAVNQYFIHARMCENWGYKKLAAYIRKQSIEEMQHAQAIIDRILYFDGAPNMQKYMKINVGKSVPEQFQNDLEVEFIAAIAIPGLLRSRQSANEASAIASMRSVSSAQSAFSASCGWGYYAMTLEDCSRRPPQGGIPSSGRILRQPASSRVPTR